MRVAVLVKYVPEPTADWSFGSDFTLERALIDGRLSELDEYAIEQAVQLREGGAVAEIVAVTMGPEDADDALRKVLAMGADSAIRVTDAAIHGSDAVTTSRILAAALAKENFDLIITGMSSTDGEMSVIPAMLAERLGVNQATFAGKLSVDADTVAIVRQTDAALEHATTTLPAVVSVTDQTGEARYPAFKAIMMAKKKPIVVWSLADLGIDPDTVGLDAAATKVVSITATAGRTAGTVVDDDGTAAAQVASFLAGRGLL